MIKHLKKLFILGLTAGLLTACGSTADTKSTVEEKNETRTVTDARGEVVIPANPEKIADLSGSSDLLSILGLKVAATANSDAYDYTIFPSYLEDALKGAKIVGYSMQDTMDIEAIMEVAPDLIIISTVQEKMYDTLKEVAPTIMIEMEQLNWKEDLNKLAGIMDRQEEAEKWLTAYEEEANKAGEEVKEKLGDKTYLAFLASGGQFFVFSGAGFGDVLYTDMGLKQPENMPKQVDMSLPVVTYEGLAAIDADYIFAVGTKEDLASLEASSVFQGITAVKEGRVIILPSSPYFNQGYSPVGKQLLLSELKGFLLDSDKKQ